MSHEELADALTDETDPSATTIDDTAIRQLVRRIRKDFGESYELLEGAPPPDDLLIQNVSRKGYRLNPTIRLIG